MLLKRKHEVRKATTEAVKAFGPTRFNGSVENARTFWNKFKQFMEAQNYGAKEIQSYAVPILGHLITAPHAGHLITAPNAAHWFTESLAPRFDNEPVTIQGLEEVFLEGWIDPMTKSMDEARLHTCAWGTEYAIPFVNRRRARAVLPL